MARKSNFAGRSEPALAKRPEAAASSSMERKVLLTPHILIPLLYTYLLSSLNIPWLVDVHAHVTLTLTLLDMYNKVCAVQMLLEKSLRWQLSLDPLAVIETHVALPGSSVFLFPHASILEH